VPTCDLYLRLSDARIEEAFEGREKNLREFATRLQWTVHRVVIENDVYPDGRPKPASAFKRRRIKVTTASGRVKTELRTVRPGFRSVLDDLTSGIVNAVIAEDLDRLIRQPRDGEDFLDAVEMTSANARSLSGSLRLTDGGTSDERFMARIMAATATKSSEDTARRVADARERFNGTSYQGGPRPFGYVHARETEKYRRTLMIVPDEADILHEATDAILDKGLSLRAVSGDLRERGVLNTHGNTHWTSQSLKHVLTKPAIAGLMTHKGTLKDAPWDEILDRDVWERLCAKLNDPARRTSEIGTEPKWLASNIARCGVCNNGTTVRATGRRDATFYTCREGYHLKRRARYVDAWIERNVTAYISEHGMDILKPEPRKEIDTSTLRAEAKRLRERKATQIRMHALGELDDADLGIGLRAIRDRLAVIDAQLAQSDQPDPIPEFRRHGPTREIWRSLSLARKRAIIRMLADITILPSGTRGRAGFDPDAVRIVLKETGDILDVRQWPV